MIVLGNPRVKNFNPYPYPAKPGPVNNGSGFRWVRVRGLVGFGGYKNLEGYRLSKYIKED